MDNYPPDPQPSWQPDPHDAYAHPDLAPYAPPPLPPQYAYYQQYAQYAPAPQPVRRSYRGALVAATLVGALAIGGGGYALSNSSGTSLISGSGTSAQAGSSAAGGSSGSTGSGGFGFGGGFGGSGTGGSGTGGTGTGSGTGTGGTGSGGGTTTSTGSATATQQIGVVDITTVLKYQSAEAAGTGMVLTSNGEILTNNHVVDGATSITVTVVSTGKTYSGTVVGTDPSQDVAVIQLTGASGLKTINLGNSSTVAVGSAVVAVGNAGGVGGTPSAVAGTVQALDQSITASDENGSNSEKLIGLIMSNAPIQAGDSGGPLYNSAGQVVGIDTAGDSSSSRTAATEAYSIPINTALSIAKQIEAGQASDIIHLGYPAFLGIGLSETATSALITDVLSGSPVTAAGVVAGDTITGVGSYPVTSAADLKTAIGHYKPGQKVVLTWTDAAGASHSATITLMTGPAD